jgi:hypothetical protein
MRVHRPVLVIVCALALPALLAGPAHGDDAVIRNGIDLWHTSPSGESYTDFAHDPIPADFFCPGSPPFKGRIHFQGVPVATEPADALGGADTLIHRLDDAVFDAQGIARVRTQVRALSLAGTQPLDAGCGRFEVTATLDGSGQPITEMTIHKVNEAGGTFVAHLELRAKLTFRPLGKTGGGPLELVQKVDFSRETILPWAYEPAEDSVLYEGFVKADTDGDGVPDTFLPGTSNFITDHSVTDNPREALIPCCAGGCWWLVCHCDPEATDPTTSCAGCQKLHCSVKVFAVCAPNSCSRQTTPPESPE